MNFEDLKLYIDSNNDPYCHYQFSGVYQNNLNLINSNSSYHLLEECEVYRLME